MNITKNDKLEWLTTNGLSPDILVLNDNKYLQLDNTRSLHLFSTKENKLLFNIARKYIAQPIILPNIIFNKILSNSNYSNKYGDNLFINLDNNLVILEASTYNNFNNLNIIKSLDNYSYNVNIKTYIYYIYDKKIINYKYNKKYDFGIKLYLEDILTKKIITLYINKYKSNKNNLNVLKYDIILNKNILNKYKFSDNKIKLSNIIKKKKETLINYLSLNNNLYLHNENYKLMLNFENNNVNLQYKNNCIIDDRFILNLDEYYHYYDNNKLYIKTLQNKIKINIEKKTLFNFIDIYLPLNKVFNRKKTFIYI